MSNTEQEKLLVELNEAHSKREQQNKELSRTFGKDLNQAQYKKDKALSDDAYPDNAHFIYEIIQNAEDSSYLKNKKAELEFHLLNDGILVLSNQDGFTNDDIRSICLMASGGKIAKKDQFIGEKGLGFRSVFKITNTPCISSNGYEFYFDKQKSYEKPFLLKNYQKALPNEFNNYTDTAIFLPYSIDSDEIYELESDFKSKIKPKLILFLKKLNSISIIKNNQKYMFIEKENAKSEIFELSKLKNNDNKQEFFITRKTINVSNLNEEKRKGIQEREIVLAYPKEVEESSSNIFAFLPTDINSRLNFTIQADFLLDTSRGHLLENEWNKNIFKEIKIFLIDNINLFQNHSKLKFEYLKYYLQETKSNNKFIDNLYNQIIDEIKNKDLILSDNGTWQKPQNIILLENNIKIDTKYLKLLFGEQYEQVHKKFKLDNYFISKFNIKRVDKEKLLTQIFIYLDKYDELNSYNTDDVFYLTKIISKYLNFGRDGRKFDEDYLKKIKKSLPIIPKYKTNKKFYLFNAIYISSEYQPKFLIENIAKENDFDFTKYNFLSDDYLEDKKLTDFIKNIIEEQEKHRNKKTIEFFIKYSDILQNYLRNNINNYKKVFEFLIGIQEDNKERISKIPLLLTQNGDFYNSTQTIYFSNDSDSNLDILDKELFEFTKKKQNYKKFLEKVFKVKEADILNIILNEYLPWIKNNYQKRTSENDNKLLKYTKDIIENFNKFEKEDKDKIKQSLFFISSNQKDKYLKSSNIYLSQDFTEIIFNNKSIEKYITDKSYFDFLDGLYDEIIETIAEEKTKEFFKYFSFEKKIKESDIPNFIKFIKKDLDLDLNIEALKLIATSIDDENRKKIKEIEKFKVYSQNNALIDIKNIFQNKINDLEIDYLHTEYYKKKISDSDFKNIKQYFQSEDKIEPFIDYLKQDVDFDEAVKVYQYLDKKSHTSFKINNSNITPQKIRQLFKENKLIYSKDNKYYSTDVTWKEEKSANQLFALSTIYLPELQNFFVKTVQVSQTKDIKQIINQIKELKEKNDDYFDLLIDLNDLISDDNELDKYDKSFKSSIHEQYNKDSLENARQFILQQEQVFILDSGQKNKNDDFYFNDLEIDDYDEKLEEKIFSINNTYPVEHYNNLVNTLKIKRLSSLEKDYANRKFKENYKIEDYRSMLHFAYDLLFTKYPDEYKKLEKRESYIKKLNEVNTINIHQDIVSQIILDGIRIELDGVKYYFKNDELFIVNKNDLFKIIAEKIGFISDDNIEMFYIKVIEGNKSKNEYYKEKNIKKKQNFTLEISNITKENNQGNGDFYKNEELEQDFDEENQSSYNNNPLNKETSAEEERRTRQNTEDNIGKHDADYPELDKELNPDIIDPDDDSFYQEGDKNHTKNSQNNKPNLQDAIQKHNKDIDKKEDDINPNLVKDEEKYREEIQKKYDENLSQADFVMQNRYRNRKVKVGKKETKEFLKQQYKGYCQICGFTFEQKNHKGKYFELFDWLSEKIGKQKSNVISSGSSLCLCSRCHSGLKYGDFEAKFLSKIDTINLSKYTFNDFIEKTNTIVEEQKIPECYNFVEIDMYKIPIRLLSKEQHIFYTEEHFLQLYTLLTLKNI